ncbi:MAG: hypothetical protein WC030_02770 [Candidatus Paceibacterota bacterium]
MLYAGSKEIEERVVEVLVEGRETVKSLLAYLNTERKDVSLRGVYKAVTNLTKAGVVLKVGKKVMLNHEWVQGVADRLGAPAVPLIARGERAVYTFTSLDHLDAFWKSTVWPLERAVEAREVFFYNPHDFWALLPARKESEEAYYRHFGPEQQGFFTIGSESQADLTFKRTYQTEFLQINLGKITSIRSTDHVTVLGSYIILARLSKAVAERIDALYASGKTAEGFLPELLKICARPGKIRLVLENNPKKADKLKKLLAKDFYFRRPE